MWSSNEYIKKIKGGFYMVKVEKTPIPGLFVVDLYSFEDHRGSFMEKFSQKDLISEIKHVFGEDSDEYKAVKDFNVVQNNVSKNNKGVIRGLHAEPWNKYIYIVSGAAYGAWVDLRSGNSRVVYFHDLTEGNAVFVPEGVANGFQSLEEDTQYSYLVDGVWSDSDRNKYSYVNLKDLQLGIRWPLGIDDGLISEADKKHPFLGQNN